MRPRKAKHHSASVEVKSSHRVLGVAKQLGLTFLKGTFFRSSLEAAQCSTTEQSALALFWGWNPQPQCLEASFDLAFRFPQQYSKGVGTWESGMQSVLLSLVLFQFYVGGDPWWCWGTLHCWKWSLGLVHTEPLLIPLTPLPFLASRVPCCGHCKPIKWETGGWVERKSVTGHSEDGRW